MRDKIKELKAIIYGMDELIDHWFNGEIASCMGADGDDVYAKADDYRNRALAILAEMEEEKND